MVEWQIEREVDQLDRKSVKERSEYFKERLKIPWNPVLIESMEKALALRNKILHEDPELHVPAEQLQKALAVAFWLPMSVTARAVALYPGAFSTEVVSLLKDSYEKTEQLLLEQPQIIERSPFG